MFVIIAGQLNIELLKAQLPFGVIFRRSRCHSWYSAPMLPHSGCLLARAKYNLYAMWAIWMTKLQCPLDENITKIVVVLILAKS